MKGWEGRKEGGREEGSEQIGSREENRTDDQVVKGFQKRSSGWRTAEGEG